MQQSCFMFGNEEGRQKADNARDTRPANDAEPTAGPTARLELIQRGEGGQELDRQHRPNAEGSLTELQLTSMVFWKRTGSPSI